jgi:hypothetical protein
MNNIMVFTNGLALVAIGAFIALVFSIIKEGSDERARLMGFKLYGSLFLLLFGGLALITFISGFYMINYQQLRMALSILMSITVLWGLLYWIFLKKNY